MATYAIGDIQGCYEPLLQLLQQIAYQPQHDQLWFTGDLVNRGPQSLAVLRFVKNLTPAPVIVLGNHDLHLLAVASGKVAGKKADTFADVLSAPDRYPLLNWLKSQPLLHHDAQSGYTLLHAGLPPQWDLTLAQSCAREVEAILRSDRCIEFYQQMYGNAPSRWQESLTGWERARFITNCLTRLRFCDADGNLDLQAKGAPGSQAAGFLPWFKVAKRKSSQLKIIFGHWAALGGNPETPGVFALDTGCVWGECLTAFRLDDAKYFKVKCSPGAARQV